MKKKKVSAEVLAADSGVHITTVRRYLGDYGGPIDIGPKCAALMAPVLGVNPSDLIYGRT